MNEVIQEGKTKEDALAAALDKLEAKEDEVEVEVIDEGREGFLGGLLGSRNCKLRVTLKEPPESDKEPSPAQIEDDKTEETGNYRKETSQDDELPLPTSHHFNMDDPPEDQIEGFLRQLFLHLKVKCDIEVNEGERDIYVDISGKDSGVVIGKFGQTLDSIQYITNVIMGKKLGNKKKIIINVGDYRSRREKSIKQLSRNVARKVVKSKKSESLAPMTPQDRRIVHLALSNFKNIRTSSEGNGNNRKVVIYFKE